MNPDLKDWSNAYLIFLYAQATQTTGISEGMVAYLKRCGAALCDSRTTAIPTEAEVIELVRDPDCGMYNTMVIQALNWSLHALTCFVKSNPAPALPDWDERGGPGPSPMRGEAGFRPEPDGGPVS